MSRRRAVRDEGGATALEFGIIAPIMFMMIFGLVQYGYLFWSLTTASATAREAARRMVVGNDWATCAVPWALQHARNPAVGADPVAVTHRYTDDAGNTVNRAPRIGDLVEVTVSFHSLDLGIPFIPVPGGGQVTQKASARVENVPDSPLPCSGPGNP